MSESVSGSQAPSPLPDEPPGAAANPFVPGRPADALASTQAAACEQKWQRRSQLMPGLVWLLLLAVLLLAVRFVVPFAAEQVAYSVARGKQKAEWEAAGHALRQVSLPDVSKASELVWQRAGPSVVHISIRNDLTEDRRHLLERFQDPDRYFAQGQGSGVVFDVAGYIVTNSHVVRGAENVYVHLFDGRRVRAEVAGDDDLTDLAVLKVEAPGMIAAEWANSDEVQIGAAVWAAGSPFGLERSLSFGIISGKDRSGFAGNAHQNFLQTDVAVNPGNSGGPLVNSEGKVVGINTAILGRSYQGVSFAIPSNVVREVAGRLKTAGYVPRGWLGVALDDISLERVAESGLPDGKGAVILAVVDEPDIPCPAKAAGLAVGDIVRRWNDEPIFDSRHLIRIVAGSPLGTDAEITVWRGKEERKFRVTVAERPQRAS